MIGSFKRIMTWIGNLKGRVIAGFVIEVIITCATCMPIFVAAWALGRIIEDFRGTQELDRFESFVYAPVVPENITELTGIRADDLVGAPPLASVLERFRLFLGGSVFVAHNVKFDYGFIDASLQKCGFGMLLNRRLCTVELARRTIEAQRYGLGSLKELLGVQNVHHRAFSDAVSCFEIFKSALSRLPWSVQSTEDLILFSKTAKSLALPKPQISGPSEGEIL